MLRFPADGWIWPGQVVLDANLSTRLPRYAWANNRAGASGSGSGQAEDSLIRTLGEYFERRHFYEEVRAQARGVLARCADAASGDRWSRCLAQTCREDARERLASHEFGLSRVLRLPDHELVWAPAVLLSVGGPGMEDDAAFAPKRDTTGCAAHFDLTRAVLGATREWVERQYLLRYWLLGAGGQDVTSLACASLPPVGGALATSLTRLGELRFIELGGHQVHAAIVLVVYRGIADPRVRYCVGLSCANSVAEAADRAIRELWQSYVFLCNMSEPGASARVHDRYHQYFLACNTQETAHDMLAGVDRAGSPSPDVFTDEEFRRAVHRHLGPLWAYIAQTPVFRRRIWCVRVLSPGAFIHLDNTSHFNLDCAFSADFLGHVRNDRRSRMVPFP